MMYENRMADYVFQLACDGTAPGSGSGLTGEGIS